MMKCGTACSGRAGENSLPGSYRNAEVLRPSRAAAGAISRVMLAGLSLLVILAAFVLPGHAHAQQDRRPSTCLAIAGNEPALPVMNASLGIGEALRERPASPYASFAQASDYTVNIRYAVHATYRIESPEGIIIATDYAGRAGSGRLPDVVTMNHAHGTHYTNNPDPGIPHVLRGWGDGITPASHYLEVGDTLIRNVTTDIYRSGMLVEVNGNSIFVFEMAGLCIGHVGHLHHTLTPEHFAAIGRLDVVMVPVDGGVTLSIAGISDLVRQFRSSIILPMHWFSGFSLQRFIDNIQTTFPVDIREDNSIDVSLNDLPGSPTVIVLQPELGTGFGMGFGDSFFDDN